MVYNHAQLTMTDVNLLKTHHRWSVSVHIMDMNRRYLFDMSDSLISGHVDIDADADCTRSGKMTLLDPQQRLSVDFAGQSWGSSMSNRMVQIIYNVYAMDYSWTYQCPIFTGPITTAKRDGVVINIEYKSMEWILQAGVLSDATWPAGWSRSSILMNAASMSGITFFNDQHYPSPVVNSPWSVAGGENLWERMKELADGSADNIFFDANGVMQIRPKNRNVVMELDTTWLTEEPDYDLDSTKIRNVVRVEGANVPGTDQKMWYEAWPPADHPYSPQALAILGRWRVIPHRISDTSLSVWSDIIDTAWNNLNWDLLLPEATSAVTPVIPFLEEHDVVRINHPKVYVVAPLSKATIPLVGDAEMSLNFLSTTSSGNLRGGRANSNKGMNGERLLNHGPSGAFNTLGGKGRGTRGSDWYKDKDGGAPASGKGGKKKNRSKGKKGGN